MNIVIKATIAVIFCVQAATAQAQTFTAEIAQFRKNYVQELQSDERSPVKKGDIKYIRFYPPDSSFRVVADFSHTAGSKPFLLPTHSGKQKPFKEYGVLSFRLRDTAYTLHVYQSVDLMNNNKHKDELFVPFNDLTNYEKTYAGGRYIDLSIANIENGKIILDFNKCYNPYCAYADGFSCPIPPDENHINTSVTAGELMFAKFISE